jgi:hypothetical protein
VSEKKRDLLQVSKFLDRIPLYLYIYIYAFLYKIWIIIMVDSMSVQTDEDLLWGTAAHDAKWPMQRDADMELYLTVMGRMANNLSMLLVEKDADDNNSRSTSSSSSSSSSNQPPKLKSWNVAIRKDNVMLPQLLPNDMELAPVIECIPMEGRVCIRLQGKSSEKESPVAVSLVFDAVFDTKR